MWGPQRLVSGYSFLVVSRLCVNYNNRFYCNEINIKNKQNKRHNSELKKDEIVQKFEQGTMENHESSRISFYFPIGVPLCLFAVLLAVFLHARIDKDLYCMHSLTDTSLPILPSR